VLVLLFVGGLALTFYVAAWTASEPHREPEMSAPGKRHGAVLGIAAERNPRATGGKRSKGDFVKIYPLEKMTKQEIDALYPQPGESAKEGHP
jgi:hypothetical protein